MICEPCLALLEAALNEAKPTDGLRHLDLCSAECEAEAVELMRFIGDARAVDPEEARCHCGGPLHYTDATIGIAMIDLVRRRGPYVDVIGSDGRRWRVQRHYIALHGLREEDLPTLGFEEIRP